MKNLLIAFEGIDGSGKSTQIKLLAEALRNKGHKVHTTCEPTSKALGKMIRASFSGEKPQDERVIAGLFVADRLQHILDEEEGILRKLKDGYTVITDRYYFSSFAYNSIQAPMDWVIAANALSRNLAKADLHIYLDIKPEESMKRISQNRAKLELYENLENQKKVYSNYQKAFELMKDEEQVFSLKALEPIKKIHENIMDKLKLVFEKFG